MLGVGSVVGFFVCVFSGIASLHTNLRILPSSGGVDLPKTFPMFGKSQLQVLTVIASSLLLFGHLVMAWMVKEKVLIKSSANRWACTRSDTYYGD